MRGKIEVLPSKQPAFCIYLPLIFILEAFYPTRISISMENQKLDTGTKEMVYKSILFQPFFNVNV